MAEGSSTVLEGSIAGHPLYFASEWTPHEENGIQVYRDFLDTVGARIHRRRMVGHVGIDANAVVKVLPQFPRNVG
eukprot:358183-Heterocapsa_arctica.AAC.1